jgi:hypothetical protein
MTFPKATFQGLPPDTEISQVAYRVLVEFADGQTYVIGSAIGIAGYLAITAKHVLEDIVTRFGSKTLDGKNVEIDAYAVRLYEVCPGPMYRIWQVMAAWSTETDIALLHLAFFKTSHPDTPIVWRSPRLRLMPPPVGSTVAGFGYHSSKVATRPAEGGGYHLELHDEPTATTGDVEEILPTGNPHGRFNFPCFRVSARFDAGMSGGPVFDETGCLCGIISGTYGNLDGPPISYVATLWPMLRTVITAKRSGNYPENSPYPVIDLVLGGQIHALGLEDLDPALFPGRRLR